MNNEYDYQTPEMTETMDAVFDLCKMFGEVGDNIRTAFQDRNGDPGYYLDEAREYLNQIEQDISDYEKMKNVNDLKRSIGV
ncbi:MAG: hypothetical protein PHU54_07985 [Candidatus Omnitrophica bacterium]|nr:hypothetical protein [Candidatus Omnitrophota bacterium]